MVRGEHPTKVELSGRSTTSDKGVAGERGDSYGRKRSTRPRRVVFPRLDSSPVESESFPSHPQLSTTQRPPTKKAQNHPNDFAPSYKIMPS